jgi:hypothetical protein
MELAGLNKAIQIVQSQLIWKPDSAERHLRKRISRGHLPVTATLADYEGVIQAIVHQPTAQVYLYWHSSSAGLVAYVTLVGAVDDKRWLVMFDLAGTLESAYVVERPQYYLTEPEFEQIGELGEIL